MNKKRSFFLLFYFAFLFSAFTQNWQSLKNGITSTLGGVNSLFSDTMNDFLYIGGYFLTVDGGNDTAPGIVRWDGNNFIPMGCGFDWDCITFNGSFARPVVAITRYKNEIYAGGAFQKADGKPIQYLAKWNGQNWDSVGGGVSSPVIGLTVINNELYVLGSLFADTIFVNGLSKWNGSQWSDVFNFSQLGSNWIIYCAALYNNELYVGGNFYGANGMQEIVRWNGSQWTDVGGGVKGDAWVEEMIVYRNELYVGGEFLKKDGNAGDYIQKWNGSQWSDVGGSVGCFGVGQIHDMAIHNNQLYVVGTFCYAGGIDAPYIAKWDGNLWCGFGSTFDNRISAIAFYNDTLYIGGGFWTIDGDTINQIAKWIGGDYVDTCGVIINQSEIRNPKSEITIFPNPFSTSLTLQFQTTATSTVRFSLYNSTGTLTLRFSGGILPKGKHRQQINTQHLSPGIYFLIANICTDAPVPPYAGLNASPCISQTTKILKLSP